jgi:hypothetical protein
MGNVALASRAVNYKGLDALMPTVVPESGLLPGQEKPTAAWEEALDALMEFTGATAGWVGVVGEDRHLTFPAYRGQIGLGWLKLQQGHSVWGVLASAPRARKIPRTYEHSGA